MQIANAFYQVPGTYIVPQVNILYRYLRLFNVLKQLFKLLKWIDEPNKKYLYK